MKPIRLLGACALSCCALSPVLSAESLLAYYAFEDNYDDGSGNGTLATESENPDQLNFVAGFRGQSLDINDPDANPNSGGKIDIEIDANPGTLPDVTFGGWINVEGFEFDGFMAMDNGGWDRGIAVNSSGDAFGVVSGAAPILGAPITRGSWQYVVGTFSVTSGQAKLYVGDDVAGNQSTQVATGPELAGFGEFVIELGRYDNQDLDAVVDDIFVFDDALSDAKVNALRNLRLSDLDYSPAQVAELFTLFNAGSGGPVAGTTWSPRADLPKQPGALIDLGVDGTGVVLDADGNGMAAATGIDLDSDDDGLTDWWEMANFGGLGEDGAGDPDGDGVDNSGEFEAGTDPNVNPDTDGDGLPDEWEFANFGDLIEDGAGDFDFDGLDNSGELAAGTDPVLFDSDGDGLADGEEVNTHQTDPLNADTDGDGYTDGAEVGAGSDPKDALSVPADTLLALFEFEDNYDDASSNGTEALPTENPDQLSFVDGFRGRSLDINDPDAGANTGGRVDILIDANPSVLPEVTFGGWVNVEGAEFDGFMAMDNGGWDRGIAVNAQSSNAFGVVSGAAPVQGGLVTRGSWQFVVGSFSRITGESRLYVGDDDLINPQTEVAFGSDLAGQGETVIELGRYDNQDLDGMVDDIFVFRGFLSEAKVNAIRNLRLSELNYSPAIAAELFALFDAGTAGMVAGVDWSPRAGLTGPPGALEDLGAEGTGIVLDDLGNGLVGVTGLTFDLDGDGLSDSWERLNFGDLTREPGGDEDGDGLSNLEEQDTGTDPNNEDSDGDGLADGAEVNSHATSPLDPDSDDDGFSDGEEVNAATPSDPNDAFSFPPPVLLAFFEFEDNYDDSSGNGTTAVPAENPDQLSFVPGFRGQSLDVNDPDTGVNNSGGRVDIGIDANPGVLPEVTFGGWVKVDQLEFDGFMAMDNGGWDRGIAVNGQDSGSFGVVSGAAPIQGAAVEPGSWQFVAATFSRADGAATLYVGDEAILDYTADVVSGPDLAAAGLAVIELGRYDNQDLDATVDDVFVFKGALSAAKMNALRNLRLSELDYTAVQAAELFVLFDSNATGMVGGVEWSPASGMAGDPGGLVDLGATGTGVILDDAGNGMSAITGIVFDSDGDGLSDAWERQNFGDLSADAVGDPDGDGLNNLGEQEAGTDPNEMDSDGDGLSDGEEVTLGSDPLSGDTDGDGYPDAREVNEGSNPSDPNSMPLLLLGYYPLEGDFLDASGSGNDASPAMNPGEVSFVANGFRGQSVDINDPNATAPNTGGSIDIPINANPPALPGTSFGGWVNVESNAFDGFMAMDNGGWDRGITVSNNTSAPGFGIASGAAPIMVGDITAGSWQYVVGTFHPGLGTALYVGDADPLNPATVSGTGADATTAPFGEAVIEVGRYDNQDLDGMVDDLFVFDGVLTVHEANAIRNLRLSSLDLSPLGAAEVFRLFRINAPGEAGGLNWSPVGGLNATNPGEVFDVGGAISVVLDDLGNGMQTSNRLKLWVTQDPPGTINLTWEGKVGKLYNVRSTTDPSIGPPLTWPIWDGNEAIVGDEPFLMLSFQKPGDAERFFVIEEYNPPPAVLYGENFDTNDGGWTTGVDGGDGNTVWGWGQPQVAGPTAAHSAPNCFGTNIDDNYEVNANIWLRSPDIDLSGANEATLRYFQFRDLEDGFDFGTVRIFNAADDAEIAVLAMDVTGASGDWQEVVRRLPATAVGRTVYLEFRFESDTVENRAGWYIDDVQITEP